MTCICLYILCMCHFVALHFLILYKSETKFLLPFCADDSISVCLVIIQSFLFSSIRQHQPDKSHFKQQKPPLWCIWGVQLMAFTAAHFQGGLGLFLGALMSSIFIFFFWFFAWTSSTFVLITGLGLVEVTQPAVVSRLGFSSMWTQFKCQSGSLSIKTNQHCSSELGHF